MDGAYRSLGIIAFFLLVIALCVISYRRRSRLKQEIILEYGSIKAATLDSDLVTSFQRNSTGFAVTSAVLLLGIAAVLFVVFFGFYTV